MINQFETCRENMVQSQLMTSGIVDPKIVECYSNIPREIFCPEKEGVCYADKTLVIDEGQRFVLEPLLHARMVQALGLKGSEIVLDVGGATGYSAAILSGLVSTVIVLDMDQGYLDRAVTVYDELGLCNVIQHKGNLLEGCSHYAPYDAIFINGALNCVPQKLIDQLAVGGRLVYVLRDNQDALGEVTLVTRISENEYGDVVIGTAKVPFIDESCSAPSFVFK